MDEETKITMPEHLPDIPTSYERFAVLIIFGGLMVIMAWRGNFEAATAFGSTIATYFLSRQGA